MSRDVGSTLAAPAVGLSGRIRLYSQNLTRFARRKPLGAAGGFVILFMLVVAIFAPLIAPYDPYELVDPIAEHKYLAPGREFLLGGDIIGRDVLSRVIFGARISMYVGVVSVLLGTTIGTFIGIVSAYLGGKADLIIQRFIDALMAFPALILAMAIMAVLGPSVNNVIAALVIVFIPGVTRVVRSQALSIREMDYVTAARAIGAGPWRIMLRHMLPNVASTLIVLATITLGWAIIVEASLSFLGVGVPPDVPSWGGMLTGAAQTYIKRAPWVAISPLVAIAVTVFAVNLLGDAMRDVLDPRLRGTGGGA